MTRMPRRFTSSKRSSAWVSRSSASEDLPHEQASDVESFQNHLPVPEPTQEQPILVVTADCKGVPLVRSAMLSEEGIDASESATPPSASHHRRGKGEKVTRRRWGLVQPWVTIFLTTAANPGD